MGQQIYSGDFNFPGDEKLPGTNNSTPFVVVGDGSFRLHRHILDLQLDKTEQKLFLITG